MQVRLVELAINLDIAIMRMRGQVPSSNPEVLQRGLLLNDPAEWTLNRYKPGRLLSIASIRGAQYYESAIAGQGNVPPQPLPLNG